MVSTTNSSGPGVEQAGVEAHHQRPRRIRQQAVLLASSTGGAAPQGEAEGAGKLGALLQREEQQLGGVAERQHRTLARAATQLRQGDLAHRRRRCRPRRAGRPGPESRGATAAAEQGGGGQGHGEAPPAGAPRPANRRRDLASCVDGRANGRANGRARGQRPRPSRRAGRAAAVRHPPPRRPPRDGAAGAPRRPPAPGPKAALAGSARSRSPAAADRLVFELVVHWLRLPSTGQVRPAPPLSRLCSQLARRWPKKSRRFSLRSQSSRKRWRARKRADCRAPDRSRDPGRPAPCPLPAGRPAPAARGRDRGAARRAGAAPAPPPLRRSGRSSGAPAEARPPAAAAAGSPRSLVALLAVGAAASLRRPAITRLRAVERMKPGRASGWRSSRPRIRRSAIRQGLLVHVLGQRRVRREAAEDHLEAGADLRHQLGLRRGLATLDPRHQRSQPAQLLRIGRGQGSGLADSSGKTASIGVSPAEIPGRNFLRATTAPARTEGRSEEASARG